MLKLSLTQMLEAVNAAQQIHTLEADKSSTRAPVVQLAAGCIEVPREVVAAAIAAEIRKQHQRLAALGIELDPRLPDLMKGEGYEPCRAR